MAKIVVNKNFNEKYLHKAYVRLFFPSDNLGDRKAYYDWYSNRYSNGVAVTSDAKIGVYENLSTALTDTWAGYTGSTSMITGNVFFVDETMLKLIDKINNELIVNPNGMRVTTEDGGSTLNDIPIDIFFLSNSLFNIDETIRRNTIQYFVEYGLITTEEYEQIMKCFSMILLPKLIPSHSITKEHIQPSSSYTTEVGESFITVELPTTQELNNFYKHNIDNPVGNNIYMLFLPYSTHEFLGETSGRAVWVNGVPINTTSSYNGGGTIQMSYLGSNYHFGYQKFHKRNEDRIIDILPYIAFSIGTSGSDIVIDHTDEIEYFDRIKVSVNIPKEY